MLIKQLQGYRTIALITLVVSLAAAIPLFDSENLKVAGFISGVLGSFLLALASVNVTIRYTCYLVANIKAIGVAKFFGGVALMFTVVFVWFYAFMKFALVPAINNEIDSEFLLPAILGVVNGGLGVLYFYFIWPFKQRYLLINSS